MKKYLTKILFAALPFVFSVVLAGAPLDGLPLEVSRNAERDLLSERIQEQAQLEIEKFTEELSISIEKHLGQYSDIDYLSPSEEIAQLTSEEVTRPVGPFPAVVLIAALDNALRASLSVFRLII